MTVREQLARNKIGLCWQHVRLCVFSSRKTKGFMSVASAIRVHIYNSDLKHSWCYVGVQLRKHFSFVNEADDIIEFM